MQINWNPKCQLSKETEAVFLFLSLSHSLSLHCLAAVLYLSLLNADTLQISPGNDEMPEFIKVLARFIVNWGAIEGNFCSLFPHIFLNIATYHRLLIAFHIQICPVRCGN